MRRQFMVICTFFAFQRQASPSARRDKLWSSAPFAFLIQVRSLACRDKLWSFAPFAIQRQSSSMARGDKLRESTPFVIQRQSSLMARRDKYGHLPPLSKTWMSSDRDYFSLPLLSRDNQVWWHAETNMVICPFCWRLECLSTETILVSLCLLEPSEPVCTWRQIMVIRILFAIQRQ